MKKRNDSQAPLPSPKREKRLKRIENIATFGLLIVAVSLAGPFFNLAVAPAPVYKWIYAAGAVIYTIARLAGVADPADSLRLRRLRRLEFWAGMAFCIASGLWFYNSSRLGAFAGSLGVIQPTVVFTLVGATIQIIAAWLIYAAQKKESPDSAPNPDKKG